MDPVEHLRIIRDKQRLIPSVAEQFAEQIFKGILQGDGLADAIDDLVVEIHHPDDFDDPEQYNEVNEDLTDAVWANIMHRVHEKIRSCETPPVPEPLPIDPELQVLLDEEEQIQEDMQQAKERGDEPFPQPYGPYHG